MIRMKTTRKWSKFERQLAVALLIALAIALAEGTFLIYQTTKAVPQFQQAKQNISGFIYGHLDGAGDNLEKYVQSRSEADLAKTVDNLGKTISICSALKESTIYHSTGEQADGTIKIWGALFLMKAYDYLCNSIKNGPTEEDYETICLLSGVFQPSPETGSHITFMSMYWNFSHSELADLPGWSTTMRYEGSTLQWPDF